MQDEKLQRNSGHWDIKRAKCFRGARQVFALYADDRFVGEFDSLYNRMLENFLGEIDVNGEDIALCRTAGEADDANAQGKTAAFLAIEGGELIGCSIDGLEDAWEKGVRFLTPVWNHDNLWCGSVNDSGAGFTAYGRDMVRKASELGIILDVSHMSDRGFWELCELTDMPFIASHSNSRAVYRNNRNLTDEQFAEIVRRGGTVGINLYGSFLGEKPRIETVVKHISYFISHGGENSVSLGCDFDGCDELPEGIAGLQDLNKIYSAVISEGYSKEIADKLFHDNLNRQVERICVI